MKHTKKMCHNFQFDFSLTKIVFNMTLTIIHENTYICVYIYGFNHININIFPSRDDSHETLQKVLRDR